MLDNILSRLGIYNLMGVLYTGTIISVTLWFVNDIFNIVKIQFDTLNINGTFLFIVISYFLGLVFQEISSFLSKSFFFRKNKLLHTAMVSKDDDVYLMSDNEMKLLKKKLKEDHAYDNNITDIPYIYNYCKSYCFEHCDVSLIDKDQSIAAMSRSLSVFFSALSVFIFIVAFFNDGIGYIWLVPVLMFFAALMFIRFRRFTVIREVLIKSGAHIAPPDFLSACTKATQEYLRISRSFRAR